MRGNKGFPEIREIDEIKGMEKSCGVIRDSFRTVAEEFNLTRNNCPTHPSFITSEKLQELHSKGLKFFGLFDDDRQIGFIAVEDAGEGVYYIEKVAVLPDRRHRGYGKKLLEYAFDCIRGMGGRKVSIGIINEHAVLKRWYRESGFQESGVKHFDRLPFAVCFMEREIS